MRQEDVFKEIALMLGVEEADTTMAGWFSKRLPAISNIIEQMSVVEQRELDAEVERINRQGYPKDIK